MKTLQFQISNEAYNLLKELNKGISAEYRDIHSETIDDFLASEDYLNHNRTLESFLVRNHGGTLKLMYELLAYGLVDLDYDAWHQTYIITDFGKKVLK